MLQYKPSGAPLTIKSGQAAQGVLGQALLRTNVADFVDGRGFAMSDFNEGAVAIDKSVTPNRIYVSDPSNHRVLGWNSIAAFTTHAPATLVFGQPNLFTYTANSGGLISRTSLSHPRGLAVDGTGNLYVADQNNNRILVYNNPFASDTVADKVFGQGGGFTTGTCNLGGVSAVSLCTPVGLAIDSTGNLYVGDFNNNRVLKYNAPLTNVTADKVYGQAGSFVSNTPNLGGVSANSLWAPAGVAVDSADNLYVVDYNNHRVLEFNKLPVTDSTADKVFGQGNSFTSSVCNVTGSVTANSLCNPRFVTTTSTAVYIADTGNQRVLKYNAPLTTNTTADRVFEQGNLLNNDRSCKTLSPASLCYPDGIAADANNNLYIVDSNNNRVLEFLKP